MNWDATYVCGGHVPKEHSVSVHYRPASEINVLARFAGVHYNHCESVRSLVLVKMLILLNNMVYSDQSFAYRFLCISTLSNHWHA